MGTAAWPSYAADWTLPNRSRTPIDVTVNEVVLAAVGGGLRKLLDSRGESVDEVVLRVMVPISLH